MVLTRNGTQTTSEMDLVSPASASGASIMEKAKANENARLANEIWFNKFSEGPVLNAIMSNFDAWNVYLIEVTTEKNCIKMLTEDPDLDPIKLNQAKNIQMFFSKTICDSLKNVVLEENAVQTYKTLLSLKPDSNVKRLGILKKVQDIDSSDIEAYVIAMQEIQKELKDIDLNMEHYET